MDSNFAQSRRLVRSHKRPDRVASLLKDVPLPMLNQNDLQMEDGHAMMKFDTFPSYRNLSHAVRGCHNSVLLLKVDQKGRHMTTVGQMRTHITTRVYVSPKTGMEVVS